MNDQQRRQYQHPNGDIELLRKNYRAALSELTFNSKPIITSLTIMAQENQGSATVIVREIENQLRINAAGQKLPILYLIDSICKNVGGVYISIFGRSMVNVFLDAYTLTDLAARERFERLLQTWKNGLPGGRPVFPRHVIEPIEKSIVFIREKQAKQHLPGNIHVNPKFVNKDIRSQVNNRDPRNRNVPPALPLKQETSLTSSTADLLAQIQSAFPPAQNYQSQNPPVLKPTPLASPITNNPINQIVGQIKAILPTLPAVQANSIEQYISQIATSSSTTPSVPATSIIPHNTVHVTPPPPKVNTADLLKSLNSMGYLDPVPKTFRLDSKDLQVPRKNAFEVLYSEKPLQCKQCGFRYPKTEKDQQKMDSHLDSHFRQNRKLKERVKRGLSRSWFVTVDEWIHGEGGESMSQQVPTFLQDGMSSAGNSKEGNGSGEEIINPDEHMVIKHTDEKKTCSICGETFIDFWNDDEEEWMFKNAVMEDERIYHATCHADAVKSGLKRKAEEEEQVEKNKQQRNA